MKTRLLIIGTGIVLAAAAARGAEWPHWRGPQFNGSTDERNLPVQWSRTENVAWSAPLSGNAASTPVIFGDHVYLSGVDAGRDRLVAMAFDRRTGRQLWLADVARGIRRDTRSNYASASPATDGKHVVFFYGNGLLLCYDPDGKLRWRRDLAEEYGEFAFLWTFASSPTLYQGRLYIQVLQRDVPVEGRGRAGGPIESYLLCIDPATGKNLWRQVRPSRAVAESREAFTTPIPARCCGREQLLVVGGDVLTGHDLATGDELWRWGTWNPRRIGHWRLVPSPVTNGDVVLVCAPKRDPIYAIRPNGSGTLGDDAVVWASWENRNLSSDVPTPALYDGDFFVLSDVRRSLARVEPATGKVKWMIDTPGRAKYEASPTVADGKIYLVNFDGLVSVLAADDGRLLHQVAMDEPQGNEVVRSSVAVAHGQLFLRTTRALYCIGK